MAKAAAASANEELEGLVMKAWTSNIRYSLIEYKNILTSLLKKFEGIKDDDTNVRTMVMAVGEAGVGKSAVFMQACDEAEAEGVKHHHSATIAEDNHGNPIVVDSADSVHGKITVHAHAAHCVPFLRKPNSKSGRGACLFDETMGGSTREHETFLRSIIDGQLDETKMFPGWLLVGATNPPVMKYTTVKDVDYSLEDRWLILPVEVPAEDRLAYWAGCMPKTVYMFLLMNHTARKNDFAISLSSRRWYNIAWAVAKMEADHHDRGSLVKFMNAQAGVSISSAFDQFLVSGDNPDAYPIRYADILFVGEEELNEQLRRMKRWAAANNVPLVGATKFDMVAFLQNDELSKGRMDSRATVNLAKFMVHIGTIGYAGMVDDIFHVVKQRPIMRDLLRLIQGTPLEKKLIEMLETSKKARYEETKGAKK